MYCSRDAKCTLLYNRIEQNLPRDSEVRAWDTSCSIRSEHVPIMALLAIIGKWRSRSLSSRSVQKNTLLRLWCVKSKAKELTRPKPKFKIGHGAPIANRKMELPCSLYLILWRSLRDLCEIQPPTNDPCIVLETPNVRCSPIVSNKTCRETRRCELANSNPVSAPSSGQSILILLSQIQLPS